MDINYAAGSSKGTFQLRYVHRVFDFFINIAALFPISINLVLFRIRVIKCFFYLFVYYIVNQLLELIRFQF